MRIAAFFLLLPLGFITAQPLAVHPDKHFLSHPDGRPFFWLGDTAWELFHRLDRSEAKYYVKKRKAQGFNLIQAVALHELLAFEVPNAYDDFPLRNANINEIALTPGNDHNDAEAYDYWDHLQYIVELAVEEGLMVGLLPSWGEYVTPRFRDRTIGTVKDGYAYGQFIGNWLKDYNDHIVWILGGDRLPDEKPKGVDIWRAMAEGITDAISGDTIRDGQANYDRTFMTYHCYASSSKWFAGDDWIDMHTWGSYHEKRNNERAYYVAWSEWDRNDHLPFVNSEPAYENLPINYDWAKVSNGRFDDFDARQAAYWSVLAGSSGHTYGAHEVWIMHKNENPHPPLTASLEIEWKEALDLPGAHQMQHLRDLLLSVDYFSRGPNRQIIADNPNDPMGRLIASTGTGYAMIYAPTGKEIVVDYSKLDFPPSSATWFDPRTGERTQASGSSSGDYSSFDPPGEVARGNDWVLLLTK